MTKRPLKVAVLAAHPDDETIGPGATLARLADEGHYIKLLTFTDGVSARGPSSKNRNDRLKSVCSHLGVSDYSFANYPDNRMDVVSLLELVKYIEKNINFRPDMVFTHHPDCLNIDHCLVYRATLTAFRPEEGDNIKIYSYHIPSSTDYNPLNNFNANTYFNVSDYKDVKLECLKKFYPEEMRPTPHSRSYSNIEGLMRTWGHEVGVPYAEKFQLLRDLQ